MKRLQLLVFVLSVSEAFGLAPLPSQFMLDYWGSKTGLPEETIYSVKQTPDGFLWLATANGLVRYDGSSFQFHQPRQDLGARRVQAPVESGNFLPDRRFVFKQEILRIGPGPRNSLWAYSASYGLLRFEDGAFHLGPKLPYPCNVVDLQEDRDGTLVVCTQGVLRIVGESVEELTTLAAGATVSAAVRDDNGKLWIGLAGGGVAELRPGGGLARRYGTKEGLPAGTVNYMLFSGPGTLWVATDLGLALVQGDQVKLFTTRDGLTSNNIRALALGGDGGLWVGTTIGLNLYREGRFESFKAVAGLPSDSLLRAILVDRESNIWITFSDTGLFRLRKPKFLSWSRPEGLMHQSVHAVLQSRGATWIAHPEGLQAIRDGRVGPVWPGLRHVAIQALEEDGEGRIWALAPEAVFIVDPRTGSTRKAAFPPGSYKMLSADPDRQGHIWLTTDRGVFVSRGDQLHPVEAKGLPAVLHRPIIRQSEDGRMWMSISTEGLFELRKGTAVRVSLGTDPELDKIHTFYIAANNDFWLGLDGGGLARWKNGKLARYGTGTDEPHSFVYNFAEDNEGYFWLGLRAGLVRVNKTELNEYLDGKTTTVPKEESYDTSDGLRSVNFGISNRTDPVTKPSRILWFSNLISAVRIDTGNIPLNRVSPPVHMEEVAADDRVLPLGDVVTIPAGTGMLRFRYSVPSLVESSHVSVSTRLEPFDSVWRIHQSRVVNYSQVPPGKYTFTVRASNNDGIWNQEGATISVVVTPLFYQTWWFRSLLAALMVAAIVALIWWRTRLLRHEKAELEVRVDLRTAELSKAKLAAENAAQVKSDFLATMSHELRTPMHGVLGTVELLADTPLNSEQRDYLETVRNSGNSLLTLLNDILDLSKMEAGRMDLLLAPFSLRRTIENVTALLTPQAHLKGISLVTAYQQGLPDLVRGDELRVRQIVLNLAGNAVKFTDRGSVTIEISGRQDQDRLWNVAIVVRDTGIGIPKDRIQELFHDFVQVDATPSRRYSGTGLGLAICQRLARIMEGSITVESVPGRGSTFTFCLSLPQSEPQAGQLPVPIAGRSQFLADVLVAEDNPVNQRLATAMLKRLGCTVTVAPDGREAVRLAAIFRYHIIFMDCQMPEMDGFEATRQIRSAPGDQPVIIAMTANALPGDRERCRDAGMNDYLSKPFRLSDLSQILDVYLPPEEMTVQTPVPAPALESKAT